MIRFKSQTGPGITPQAKDPTWAPCLQLSSPCLWGWSQPRSCELPAQWCAECPRSVPIMGCRREVTSCDKSLQWGLLWLGWLVRVRLSHFLPLFAVKICSKPISLKFAKLLLHIIPFTSWSKCAFDQNLSFYDLSLKLWHVTQLNQCLHIPFYSNKRRADKVISSYCTTRWISFLASLPFLKHISDLFIWQTINFSF